MAALLCVYLLARWPARRFVRGLAIAGLGTIVGLLVSWLVSDVWNVFGVSLTGVVRMWVALAFAGVFLAVANLFRSRCWRKAVAVVCLGAFAVMAAAGINVDFGAYRNLNDALGISPYPALSAARLMGHAGTMDTALASTWRPPAGMPSHGTVGMVSIPGIRSHFAARKGVVYLPPASLVAHPPVLPVAILFAGQPGAPTDMFTSGRVATTLDAYAAKHHGLAPIVVVPDQLGRPDKNPMCVDSPLGHVATYVTQDVVGWIRGHVNVADSPRYWAIGGYSEGGTCAIQFGAGHPNLFGSIIDILGQLQPTIGPGTVAKAFHGSAAAYNAVKPLTLLTQHTPYADSVAIFGEGTNDPKYVRYGRQVKAAAAKAGMRTHLIMSPKSGHDWNTVRYVLARALPELFTRLGLGR
ncbi:MAG: hypothetical protein EPN48_11300 [Microbacteriaceae bacterium]|nr:MAG: hypothetical protein EPN48_11300 [Microbacteriaceae bacterium]